jgi:multidrug efflux pump subunit AcrB
VRADRQFSGRGIDKGRDGYAALVHPLARRTLITGALVAAFALAAGWLATIVPSGFLPKRIRARFSWKLSSRMQRR